MTKETLQALTLGVAVGVPFLLLLPSENFDKVPEVEELIGDLPTTMATAAGLALLSDPANLPDTNTEEGKALTESLLEFSSRIGTAASALGCPISSNPDDWNSNMQAIVEFLKPESAEQEPAPLTEEQAQQIVDAAASTEEGAQALQDAVGVVEEELGIQVSETAALQILSGKKILDAQKTSVMMTGVASTKIKELAKTLTEVTVLLDASTEIQEALLAMAENAGNAAEIPAKVVDPA